MKCRICSGVLQLTHAHESDDAAEWTEYYTCVDCSARGTLRYSDAHGERHEGAVGA